MFLINIHEIQNCLAHIAHLKKYVHKLIMCYVYLYMRCHEA